MKTLSVFHLDDDLFELRRIADALHSPNEFCKFDVQSFSSHSDLITAAQNQPHIDIFLLDMHLGDDKSSSSGTSVMSQLRKDPAFKNSIFMMHSGDVASIKTCLTQGADDFILKAKDLTDLPFRLFTIHRHCEVAAISQPKPSRYPPPVVIGKSMQELATRLGRIAQSAIRSIYVLGPSGSGKEVLASVLEANLPEGMPFVRVNCAAITPTLLESELFGHGKGAFTGAVQARIGLLESASGGWIFLDEVASLSPSAQAAMLRAIENQEIIRVGETAVRKIHVKFMVASNISLETLVAAGQFRNDLFQRFREAELVIPPLNQRKSDISPMIDFFCETEQAGPYRVSPEARMLLEGADWSKGNVRALRNTLRAMTEYSANGLLTAKGLPQWIFEQSTLSQNRSDEKTQGDLESNEEQLVVPFSVDHIPSFETLCNRLLVAAVSILYQRTEYGSLRKVADALGLSRTTMTNHLKKAVESKEKIPSIIVELLNAK